MSPSVGDCFMKMTLFLLQLLLLRHVNTFCAVNANFIQCANYVLFSNKYTYVFPNNLCGNNYDHSQTSTLISHYVEIIILQEITLIICRLTSCFIFIALQTITAGMAENTRDDIVEMSRWLQYKSSKTQKLEIEYLFISQQ